MLTSAKQAANHRVKLSKMRAKLIAMSLEWEDVDEFFRSKLEQLAGHCDELDSQFVEFVADEKEFDRIQKPNKNQLSLLEN